MLMTTRLRYAVMFMVGLVQQSGPSCNSKPKRASAIADVQSLSEGYLEKVVASLKGRGLIRSVKGPGGGYALNVPPERITLDMLLESVGDKVKMVRCDGGHEVCLSSGTERCNSHRLWHNMEKYVMHYLSNTSILDVCNDTFEMLDSESDFIYADHNATSEVSASVRHKVANALLFDNFYNPSSMHKWGQGSRKIVEDARAVVIEALNAQGYDVIFTSSGTEANNLVFSTHKCRHIISAIEHPSVINAAVNPLVIPVNQDGVVSVDKLVEILESLCGSKALLSVMLANNETGVIQPVERLLSEAKKYGVITHVDAVQACGKIPLNVSELGADFVTISSHKIGGISGSGALLHRKGIDVSPMMLGGSQERGLRAGTENVPAIYSLSIALKEIEKRVAGMQSIRGVRDFLESELKNRVPACTIVGEGAARLPNTTCVIMPGVSAETQLIALDKAGIAVGIGSACSSGKISKSHVLSAMGIDAVDARSAIRISFGTTATIEQAARIARCWHEIYENFCNLC